ncbi:MAG: DUF5916 domain-containing protein [Myxococcota bacterium]|nr:DUF5916 domain-containing protein [Myxococcota bacterium]
MLFLLITQAAWAEGSIPVLRTDNPVTIDGLLDEEDWKRATPVTEFNRYIPTPGPPSDEHIEARFLQDDTHLYISISVRGTSTPPRARISPRENINDDDQIGIYLDTFGESTTGYIFYLNPLGIQQDIRYSAGNWFPQWDTVFTSEGHATEDGFVIEVAMPFRSLRYPDPDGTPQTWGLILTRKIPAENSKYSHPQIRRSHPRIFTQAAPLTGVMPAPLGAGLSIQPALTLRHQRVEEDGDLSWTGLEPINDSIRPGVDLRLGITPDLGAAFTVNPDFSQVEADVVQVNLNQRFAFYYPEQRPFFLDGIDAFADTSNTLYTRSIVSPLYGVKMSGQEGPASIGILQSIDGQPGASVHELSTPGFSEEDLTEAVAQNAVGRVRLDAFSAGSVGLTLADKRVVGSTGGYNDVLAADIIVPFAENWVAVAHGAGSVAGDAVESLSGGQAGFEMTRSPGLGLGGGISASEITPGYRQEMGFLTQSGIRQGSAWLDHTSGQARRLWSTKLLTKGTLERDKDHSLSANLTQNATIGVHSASLSGALMQWQQSSVQVDGYSLSGKYQANLTRVFKFSLSSNYAQLIDYAALVPATSFQNTASSTLRPTTAIRVDLDFNRQWYIRQESDLTTYSRLFTRFNWQFTEPMGLRLLQQTVLSSDDATQTTISGLLTWMKVPGNELYIGTSMAVADSALVEQTLFAKFTHLWRL